ncbi:hypothetical protein Tco_0467806 [Tanacetum coccineum]
MTRSLTSELFTPYKEPKREFRSSRRHFKALSLDELRSPDFNLFFNEKYSEEEVAETMAETMEQYMSKTRANYGSGVVRPKIENTDNFELKGQFLKELRTNTFSGSDHEGAIPSKTAADAEVAIQEMAEYSQKWHNGTSWSRSTETSDGLAAIQAQLNNLGREIKKVNEKVYVAQVGCKQCKYTKNCPLKEEGKTLEEAYYMQFGRPFQGGDIEQQLRDSIKGTTQILRASVSVMPLSTYLNLGLGELAHTRLTIELADRTVKYPKGIAKNVLAGIHRINDLNEPYELRRNQGDDLMATIEKCEVIEQYRTMNDELDSETDYCPSYCNNDKRIDINFAHNLKFSCMIRFEFPHANFFPLLYVNIMSKKLHNSIMKDKMVYKGNNVIGALMNVPIFIGTFSVVTDFAVLEDMDAYRDEGMGDVIFGEPFLRGVGIKTRWFEGMITNYNGNDEVTYQMVRSHLKFKHHTNKQCNKIPPLLKVSKEDMMNGISHLYQKLKWFYKGVLNLGPDYIRDAKMKEWLTHGHISVHEME